MKRNLNRIALLFFKNSFENFINSQKHQINFKYKKNFIKFIDFYYEYHRDRKKDVEARRGPWGPLRGRGGRRGH
jgi:hypothetical protein